MERILQISRSLHLSHIGSCLTAYPIIKEIFRLKEKRERFVLSCGHAALALYVVLEEEFGMDAEELYHINGTHPMKGGLIDCSTGSLGMGLGIAKGMALADRSKNVYCLISDGECAEGSIWEALKNAHDEKLDNLKVYVNANGWAAYDPVDLDYLEKRLEAFFPVVFVRSEQKEPFTGMKAHYMTI